MKRHTPVMGRDKLNTFATPAQQRFIVCPSQKNHKKSKPFLKS